MFSVIVPLYNKEFSIKNTIQSVLNQTCGDFEIIIVNDGSTDGSLQVVKSIDDARVRIIDKPNGGVSSARNRGVEEAKYEWIAFLDGDDIWKENHLEVLRQLINSYPKDKVFCTSYIRSDQMIPTKQSNDILVIEDYFLEAHTYFFWTSVVCLHSSVFKNVGLFLDGYSRGEDLELWQRIGRYYRFIRSKTITAVYKIDAENKLTNTNFIYSKSTISNVHKRFSSYTRSSEKIFYLKALKNSSFSYLKKGDFKSCFRTLYRLIVLSFKKIKH